MSQPQKDISKPSLEGFRAYAKMRALNDPNERYDYKCTFSCAVAQYLQTTNKFSDVDSTGFWYHYAHFFAHADFCNHFNNIQDRAKEILKMDAISRGAHRKEWTWGALAERLDSVA